MTSFIRVIVRQRAAVILFALILLAAGGFTATRLQEELLPNVSFNTVTVVTADPGASPNTVLKDVTKPVEVAVAGVPGINTLASTSAQNASVVTVQFNYGTDINQAESKISTAVAGLPFPTGVLAPKVSTVDFSAFPILYLGVNNTNGKASLQDTYTLVNTQVKPQLEQISGVAAADVGGGANPRVTVTLNPTLMAKYGVTPAQVNQVLQANNVGIPGGNVTNNGVTEPVVTNGALTTLTAIRNLPITVLATSGASGASGQGGSGSYTGGQSGASNSTRGGYAGSGSGASSAGASSATRSGQTGSTSAAGRTGATVQPRVVYLRDVATVSEGAGDVNVLGNTPGQIAGIVRFNGKPAISITIRKNSDANIVKVAEGVQAKVHDL
nr:efflux RND transporter permease subunit [Chloroflexota bacterium]